MEDTPKSWVYALKRSPVWLKRVHAILLILSAITCGGWVLFSSGNYSLGNFSSMNQSKYSFHTLNVFHKLTANLPTLDQYFPFGRHNSKKHSRKFSMGFDVQLSLPYYYKVSSSHPSDKFRQKPKLDDSVTLSKHIANTSKLILFLNIPGWYRRDAMSHCLSGVNMCPVKSCQCTSDSKKMSLADAVIIDGVELGMDSPPSKKSSQVWIYFGHESPNYYSSSLYKSERWRHMFNWTMTYRLDSDIPIPYDILIRRKQPSRKNFTDIALKKTKSAVWLVGNCHTRGRREEYVKQLRKYYNVDIFGRCGKKAQGNLTEILRDYRFYLAFENGFCFDYITEKLFKTYADDIDIIPIVRGGADYDSMIPSGIYINTANFSSPEKLGNYLKSLDNNVTAYTEILNHKDKYLKEGNHTRLKNGYCDICVKLHNLDVSFNHYTDIGKWINEGICQIGTDI